MAGASGDGKLAWTDEARFQFLLRVVAQLQKSGQSIKWDEINMPGRTPKSLQHQWAKIKSLVAELENGGGQPAKKNVKGKGKRKGTDDESASPQAKAQKRSRLPDSCPAKKEESDEE